ncbi:MAG: lysozyme inhibitor LprI family protein [Pseudomonadota bacterium]|nr:lysozyme inhibitor LprI family protein [Pseudomonadota bacterium]
MAARTPELSRCLETGAAAKGVSVAMGGCFNAELQLQDARLNAAYSRAMARLDAAGQARLRREERAWIRQRDEGCAQAATGGTIDQVEIPACLLDETVRRRLELEAIG